MLMAFWALAIHVKHHLTGVSVLDFVQLEKEWKKIV
jgi:hypothetical protein